MEADTVETTPPDSRVAIVVASRNRRDLLRRTLAKHLALPERPRVVLVDDASTDGTADAVRAALPEVAVIRLPRNIGGAARNAGLLALDTPYVALCDDDSWWRPGALAGAADLLDRHPRLAVINGHILVGPGEHVDPLCDEMARARCHGSTGSPATRCCPSSPVRRWSAAPPCSRSAASRRGCGPVGRKSCSAGISSAQAG